MSEITKLYEKAGVKKQIPEVCSSNELYCKECKAHIEDAMPYCKNAEYPPFTAEKQLELLKLHLKNHTILCVAYIGEYGKYDCPHYGYGAFDTFEEALCADINYHWDNNEYSEEEKQQIKEILE